MVKKRITMNKIREMKRMHEASFSQRQIARALKISRSIIQEYLSSFKQPNLKYEDIKDLSDELLAEYLDIKAKNKKWDKYNNLLKNFQIFQESLKEWGLRFIYYT